MPQVLTAEEVQEKSAAEIGGIIRQAMDYDEYRWQREKNMGPGGDGAEVEVHEVHVVRQKDIGGLEW